MAPKGKALPEREMLLGRREFRLNSQRQVHLSTPNRKRQRGQADRAAIRESWTL